MSSEMKVEMARQDLDGPSLAEITGTTSQHISRIRDRKGAVSPELAQRIADILNCSPEYLFEAVKGGRWKHKEILWARETDSETFRELSNGG